VFGTAAAEQSRPTGSMCSDRPPSSYMCTLMWASLRNFHELKLLFIHQHLLLKHNVINNTRISPSAAIEGWSWSQARR